MKKLILSLTCAFSILFTTSAFAHEALHDFEVTVNVRGAPVVVYKVNQVPHKIADVLCATLTETIKAWKLSPTTDPLVLESTSGKVTLFEKTSVDSVSCNDITQQKEHKEPKPESRWVLVRHCGRCPSYYWMYR